MNDTAAMDAQSVEEFLGSQSRPRWRRWMKYWLPALVILVLVIAFARSGNAKQEYITEPVVERSLDIVVTATGNLRPTNQVDVGSEVSGRIDRVLVDVNDLVSRGQVLAQINTDVIDDQIRQAQANLNSAHASVAQAGATLDVDTAQLARLQEVWRLSEGKVPSKTELEAAEANVKRDKAGVASARAGVASAQAQLSSGMTNRDRAVIRSPVSGVVLARQVEPGQTVAASFNTPTMFVIAEDLAHMQLRVIGRRSRCRTGQGGPEGQLYRRCLSRPQVPGDGRTGRSGVEQHRAIEPAAATAKPAKQLGDHLRGAPDCRQCRRPAPAGHDCHRQYRH